MTLNRTLSLTILSGERWILKSTVRGPYNYGTNGWAEGSISGSDKL